MCQLFYVIFIYLFFVSVLWHIILCRLFNAKSIFMKIVLFQTIQFRINMQFKGKYSFIVKKHFYFKLFSLVKQSNSANSVEYKNRFSLHTVKCQNKSILNNSV